MALKKVTQRDIENLSRLYLEARNRLLAVILNPNAGVGTKTYYNSIVRQLTKELNALSKASTRFIDTTIPREYRDGLKEIYTYFRKHKLVMKDPSAFASIHTDAAYEIAREMQYQIHTGLQTVGRQVMRYANLSRDEALRQVGLHQTGLKIASGGTITDMRAAMIRELQDNGFMTVQYGSGPTSRQVAIDVYASMVARSTSREAGNTARLNQLTENGYDLVIMTRHYPTCAKCAPLQDRVFSISGNDKRFPPLSVAFGAYNNVHPNCRHSVHPWIEALKSPEEIREAIEFSNQPFDDPREQKEIALYKKQQDDGRRMRNDLYQWERYKTFLGDDAPKTFSAFRRIKNAGGERWDELQTDYRQARRDHGIIEVAKVPGGRHYGKYLDMTEYTDAGLERTLRSMDKKIFEHQEKLSNPASYDQGWADKGERARTGLLNHWEKEITNFQEQSAIAQHILRGRRRDQ